MLLRSDLEHDRINKRMDVMCNILNDHGFTPEVIEVRGTTPLQQILWTILLGDYVSAYMGLLNGIDPTPVDLVEDFKKKLG